MNRTQGTPWLFSPLFFGAALRDFYLAWRQRPLRASERRADQILVRAAALQKTDPIAAERLLDELFIPEGELASREIDELPRQAAGNVMAAAQLLARLRADLKVRTDMKEFFQRRMRRDPQLPFVLSHLERTADGTRRLLKEAEDNLLRLRAG